MLTFFNLGNAADGGFSPEHADTTNTLNDDVLQMALKMASDFEPAPEFGSTVGSTPVAQTVSTQPPQTGESSNGEDLGKNFF